MEKDTTSQRLIALDGLRGFAILMVFFNHLSHVFFTMYLPSWLAGPFFSDGVTGVTLLFLLSGFLMAYIYPSPQSWSHFVQKRYTRIFPLFLVMCTVMFFYHLYPTANWLVFMLLITGFALLGHLIWVYFIKKLSSTVSRLLFYVFLVLQGSIAIFYGLWVMRQPAIVFNQQLPESIQQATIFLVNATLTLPLGDYVPMLDGVYWSLVAEVLFYVLYPVLVVPLVHMAKQFGKSMLLLFLSSILLFLGGVHALSQEVAVLSLVQPALWAYFVIGILLATIYKAYPEKIMHVAGRFTGVLGFVSLLFFLVILVSEHALGNGASNDIDPWIRLLYAIPIGMVVMLLLHPKTLLARIFANKILVFLGTISYSIYLSHAITIHVVDQLLVPSSLGSNILYLFVVSGITISIATFLYYFLERPYFHKRQKTATTSSVRSSFITKISPIKILLCIGLLYIFGIFWVYQSQLNFFSLNYALSPKQVAPLTQERYVSFTKHPKLVVTFTGAEQNLGLLMGRFLHTKRDNPTGQRLLFSLYKKGSTTPIATTSYTLDYFNDKEPFPFGFPTIRDAKNQEFMAVFELADHGIKDELLVDNTSFYSIYAADKKAMLTNPTRFAEFLFAKTVTVVTNSKAQLLFVYSMPLALITVYLLFNPQVLPKE